MAPRSILRVLWQIISTQRNVTAVLLVRRGSVAWPPPSPDLAPNGFSVLGHLRDSCMRLLFKENDNLAEFKNCPTRCDLFSLLYFCRQLYMFRALTPIIRSSYNCNYSFWYWLTGSTTIRSLCWVESVPTQQRERMVVDLVNQYQKL